MMSSITELLKKRKNAIERQKSEQMESLIDKLKGELKNANSLAEERKQIIERLVAENSVKKDKNLTNSLAFDSFRKRILQILGVKQIGITYDEILLEVSEYKTSTTFWRQKYHNLCTDIELLAQSLQDSNEEVGHQTDVDLILKRIKTLIKQIDELKVNYNKLSKQMKDKENYCQTLIELRDKLFLEINSLQEENSKIGRNRDSLNEKCCLQNKIIEVFEEVMRQKNNTSKLIERNKTLTNELKKYKNIHVNSVNNLRESESDLKESSESFCESREKEENNCEAIKVANQVICDLKQDLENESAIDSTLSSCETIFNTPKCESKKRQYSLRSGSKDSSSTGNEQNLSLSSSGSFVKRRQRSLQSKSNRENKSTAVENFFPLINRFIQTLY